MTFDRQSNARRIKVESGVTFSRIQDPTPIGPTSWDPVPLFGDPTPKLGDQLEICSAMSPLVITHHDSYKYALRTFPFHHVAVVVRW